MFRSCVHTHTHFCDGKDSPEAMVLAALNRGFVSLGFSGHCHADYDIASMSEENELAYREEIRRLQQVYGDRLEILLGLEHDAYAPYSDFPYDYQIESVHHIWVGKHCVSNGHGLLKYHMDFLHLCWLIVMEDDMNENTS